MSQSAGPLHLEPLTPEPPPRVSWRVTARHPFPSLRNVRVALKSPLAFVRQPRSPALRRTHISPVSWLVFSSAASPFRTTLHPKPLSVQDPVFTKVDITAYPQAAMQGRAGHVTTVASLLTCLQSPLPLGPSLPIVFSLLQFPLPRRPQLCSYAEILHECHVSETFPQTESLSFCTCSKEQPISPRPT